MSCIVWKEKSRNRLTVIPTDEHGAFVTDAVVTMSLHDKYNSLVDGVSWPQDMTNPTVMPPIPAGIDPPLSAVYTIELDENLEIRNNSSYYAEIIVSSETAGYRTERQLISVTD